MTPPGAFDVARWESFFTTRDGALSEIVAMRASASWRATTALRKASETVRLSRQRGDATARFAHPSGTAAEALRLRLLAVAPHLLSTADAPRAATMSTAELVDEVTAHVARTHAPGSVWLLFVALSGAMPDEAHLLSLTRALDRAGTSDFTAEALRICGDLAREHRSQLRRLRVETTRPVVLIDFVATHGANGPAQRLARAIARRWAAKDTALVAVTADGTGLRDLGEKELEHAIGWQPTMLNDHVKVVENNFETLVVPWHSSVLFAEVPARAQSPWLGPLAAESGSRSFVIGQGLLATAAALYVETPSSLTSAAFLTLVKHVGTVLAPSEATAREFRGFAHGLAAQGLAAPQIEVVRHPHRIGPVDEPTAPPRADPPPAGPDGPSIVAVGELAAQLNYTGLFYAAEALWREGLHFTLTVYGETGHAGWGAVADAAQSLRAAGRPLRLVDVFLPSEVDAAVRGARATAYLPFHDDFAAPAAFSLSAGTPVLAGSTGPSAELEAGGGVLLVDIRDDQSVIDGLRSLLTDDELVARLRAEAVARDDAGWNDYSDALWERIVEGRR